MSDETVRWVVTYLDASTVAWRQRRREQAWSRTRSGAMRRASEYPDAAEARIVKLRRKKKPRVVAKVVWVGNSAGGQSITRPEFQGILLSAMKSYHSVRVTVEELDGYAL